MTAREAAAPTRRGQRDRTVPPAEQRHAQAFGQPEAVADAVALLVSHDARWITGHQPPPTGSTPWALRTSAPKDSGPTPSHESSSPISTSSTA
ncbi:hypothetical protein ACWFRQ_36095 [Streptomyces niveus]